MGRWGFSGCFLFFSFHLFLLFSTSSTLDVHRTYTKRTVDSPSPIFHCARSKSPLWCCLEDQGKNSLKTWKDACKIAPTIPGGNRKRFWRGILGLPVDPGVSSYETEEETLSNKGSLSLKEHFDRYVSPSIHQNLAIASRKDRRCDEVFFPVSRFVFFCLSDKEIEKRGDAPWFYRVGRGDAKQR